MAVELRVATARDVDPEVELVGGFEDELIVVGVVLDEVEPPASLVLVGVTLTVMPLEGSDRQSDVGCFTELVLRVLAATHIVVDHGTAIARTDGDGLAYIIAQRLEDILAEVAQIIDYRLWCVVVDLATACCLTTCKLRQLEVF